MAKKKAAAKKKKTAGKKKTAAKRTTKKAAKEMLLVGSKTKAAMKAHGVNVASDALDSLNDLVYWYVAQAVKRAGSNGRKTVRGHDFMI